MSFFNVLLHSRQTCGFRYYSTSLLKQYSTVRHVTALIHILLTLSQTTLYSHSFMLFF